MKRVYYGLLAAFLALALCVSPCWADDVTTFEQLKTALANGGNVPLKQSIAITGDLDGNGGTITRDSSFTTGSMLACSKDSVTISNLIIDGGGVETTISSENSGGGGLFIDNAAVTVKDCTFKNHVIKTGSALGYVGGGALYTLNAKSGTVVENCVFEGNIVAQTKGGNENGGGAVYNLSTATTTEITFTSCDFTGNSGSSADILSKTTNLDKDKEMQNTSGGAMSNVTGAASAKLTVTLERCVFTNNRASRYGGAIYNLTDVGDSVSVKITDSKFESNRLVGYENNGCLGGAVGTFAYAGNVDLTVENTLFKGNIAANTKINANGFGARGGALCSWTNYGASKTMTVTTSIVNCRFEANEANTGGAMANWGNSGTANVTELNNCTFINNKATVTDGVCGPNITNAVVYPRGGAVFTRGNADGKHQDQKGEASTTLYNCTFYNNESYSGGAVANTKGTSNSVTNTAETTLYNCTFVNNTLNSATDNNTYGLELYNDGGTLNVTNTVFYNPGKTLVTTANDGAVTLKNSAYNGTLGVTADTATKANAVFTNAAASKTATVTVNGVAHTVFKLTASDTDLIDDGTTGTGIPTTDQLGVTRSTSNPSIGAVEYLTLEAISEDKALPEGTVGEPYSQKLNVKFNTAQTTPALVWSLKSGSSLPGGLTLSADLGVISGEPTTAGDYTFTITVAGSEDTGYAGYTTEKEFTLKINAAPVVVTASSPDIGTVSITVKNAVGSNTAAFSVTSGDVKLVTSNDLMSSVKVNGTAYKLASSDATPVFSVNAGNATLKAAYMGDANSDWSSTSDLDALTITDLTAISGQEAISETSPDYYRFQFNVSDDYYFTLELSVLLSGEPEAKVTSDEVTSGSVSEPTETFTSGDETYYRVPANGSDNLVTKNASGVWQLPRVISFAIMGGFNNFISMMRGIDRTIAQIVTGIFQPNADGLFTNIGATLSTAVHPGTIFIIRLAPSGWRLPFMTGFERGAMRVAKVEDGAIIGAMTVQNTAGNSNINEEITTLNIDTSDLRDPDDSSVKVPVPEGAYAISYSTLNGEVYGAFSDDIKVAAANYTPSNGDDDTDTDDEQETSSHGGSSGCNAGFGLFALAALALAFRKFSK